MKQNRAQELYDDLKEGKVQEANILMSSISFYDNYESFCQGTPSVYHGFLMEFFSDFSPMSNRESEIGKYDVGILTKNPFGTSILFEFKHSKHGNDLEKDSQKAADQIINQKYIEGLRSEGYRNIKGYGIAFYEKYCFITKVE